EAAAPSSEPTSSAVTGVGFASRAMIRALVAMFSPGAETRAQDAMFWPSRERVTFAGRLGALGSAEMARNAANGVVECRVDLTPAKMTPNTSVISACCGGRQGHARCE